MSGRNLRIKDGSIQLTHCDGHDTALLTVRGKDHDLDAGELLDLARACEKAAWDIERRAKAGSKS